MIWMIDGQVERYFFLLTLTSLISSHSLHSENVVKRGKNERLNSPLSL